MNIKNKTWLTRSIISMAVTSALLSNTVIAAENQDVDTTTITGESLSALDISIDQDALEKSQASDLKDIFKNEAEISVGGGNSTSQKVYVRGLESTMLNVTIDGARQSSSNFHHQGSIYIEPELLKQVDVKAGAGNALSGPGALGGSLSFTTKDPEDLLKTDERFGAVIKGSYSTNANAYKASASLYGKLTDNWSAMGTIVQAESDNYQDGDGNEVKYTDDNQQNGLIKVVGNFNNNQRLSLSYDNRINDGERTRKSNWSAAANNPAFDQEADRKTATIEYSLNPSNNNWLALETNVYHTEANVQRDDTAWAALYGGGLYYGDIETYGFDIRNTSEFANNSVTYGIDYHQDTSTYDDLYTSADETSDTSDVYGAYLQADIPLAKAWLFSIGSRYDTYKTTDSSGQYFEDSAFSPNASIQFTPSEDLKLALSYAQAMRGVQVIESFILESYTNAADLEAQTTENIELSLDYQLDELALSAKIYHSTIDDVITYGEWGDSDYKVYHNSGELITEGVTLGANYNWHALQTSISYNHNIAELNGESLDGYYVNTLGASTGDSISTSLNYQLSESLEFGWSAIFMTHFSDVSDDFEEKAGYGVHDIYGQWLPLNDDSLKVTLTISNLFDKAYRDQGTFGVSIYGDEGDMSPGRDFKLAVAWAL
ncbi:TonB-dependent receptor domain-containing protein [Psychromonas algicola]|uniref:TonB-dependent receptor domain-containing protein n=1 Tax=Psychromonas algicola TaxID=2555642 RepID=UPI00106887FD|nr:TonB-dependent receptor [Psychromonas sp. RZ5]TEW52785.1 TonB-dependent receptor [Psychromonas sp. RZ5]